MNRAIAHARLRHEAAREDRLPRSPRLASLPLGVFASLIACHATSPPTPPKSTVVATDVDSCDSAPMSAMAAHLVRSGIRSSMLMGDGLHVRDFIEHVREGDYGLAIKIYDRRGEAIYEAKPPPPPAASLPPAFHHALATGTIVRSNHGAWAAPIEHAPPCSRCHEQATHRGVLFVDPDPTPNPRSDEDRALALHEIIGGAFEHMMTIGAAEELGEYFESLPSRVPGIRNSAVFSRDGQASIGDAFMELPDSIAARALQPGPAFVHAENGGYYVVKPLPNARSCQNCHDSSSQIRGALVTHFDASASNGQDTLPSLMTVSLHHIMLNGLGRILHSFLEHSVQTPLIARAKLLDAQGRSFFDSTQRHVPFAHVRRALAAGVNGEGLYRGAEDITYILPLISEPKCRQCHFDDASIRGLVEVRVPVRTRAEHERCLPTPTPSASGGATAPIRTTGTGDRGPSPSPSGPESSAP